MESTFPHDESIVTLDYVPETRFGVWFLRTDMWRKFVVSEAVAELAALLPPGRRTFDRVLDAGCGEGVAFEFLQRQFGARSLVGIDANAETLSTAARLAAESGGRIQTRLADMARLPFENGSLDLVFCNQVLHHVSDPSRVLREIRRVLARDGWLIVSESCRPFIEWWLIRLLFRHPERVQHTAAGYVDLIRESGFTVDATGVSTPAPWWSQQDLGVWQRLGGSIDHREPTQVRIAARRADGDF
jgi:SAM-dependent methyltransferase